MTAAVASTSASVPDVQFELLAQRASRRQALGEALRLLAATGPWFLLVCVAAGLLTLCGLHVGWWLALTVPLWLLVIAGLAWHRRPSAARALAQWDDAAKRANGFLNAWDFARSGAREPFALAHLTAMRQAATRAARDLSTDLPLGWSRDGLSRMVLAPLACGVLALAGVWSVVPTVPEAQLGSEERERFTTATTELAAEAKRLTELAGLAPTEKTAAEDLAKRLAEAKAEAEAKGLTAHEALAAMDRLAKDAEKLAAQLADAPVASAALLDELAKHADTAALAEALRSGDLAKAAAAAEALAAKAARTDTSLEEQRRLEEALKAATAAAAAAGDKGAVAKALAEAQAGLGKQGAKPGEAQTGTEAEKQAAKQAGKAQAGKALSSLSKALANSATRKQASKQVQQLAQRLRAGGGKVLAGKPGSNRSSSNAPVSNRPFTPNAKPSLPTPGAKPGNSAGGKGGKPGGSCSGGTCAGGSGTPVPGTQSGGGSGAGAGAGSGSAPTPVPGVSQGLARAGGRGTKAGRGHVDRSMAPSALRSTVDGGTVDAAQGAGDSTSRAVSGSEHGEDSALAATATPAALIDAEERALDAEPLPLARREQVKRYFALLRASADAVDGK